MEIIPDITRDIKLPTGNEVHRAYWKTYNLKFQ